MISEHWVVLRLSEREAGVIALALRNLSEQDNPSALLARRLLKHIEDRYVSPVGGDFRPRYTRREHQPSSNGKGAAQ